MNWVKGFQEAAKLIMLFGLLGLILWSMPEQVSQLPHH